MRPGERPSWDEWALRIAEVVSTRADCTRSQVGAVLLSHDHRVLSVGYNGVIAGVPGCMTAGNCPRGQMSYAQVKADSDYSNCIAEHAERNALSHADPKELPHSTLYVTRKPCPACTTLIEACGISRVVVAQEAACEHPGAHITASAHSAAETVLYQYCPGCKERFSKTIPHEQER